MDGGNWTVVVRRRASKLRPTSSDSSKSRGRAPKAPPLQAYREDQECDEALLLLKMKRSMARVQESSFFKMLLDQVQSPPVLNHLRRAASASASCSGVNDDAQGSISDEDKVRENLGSHISVSASTHNSQGIISQVRSSTEGCARTLLHIPCQITQNEENCNASVKEYSNGEYESLPEVCHESGQSNESRAFLETSIRKSCIGMECETSLDGGLDEGIKWDCGCVEEAHSTTHVEFANDQGIDGKEVCTLFTMKQRPCCKISGKPWRLQVVLYGLGSIADSEISRCQFALILLLKQRFAWVGDVEVYDPVLSSTECKVIAEMGCIPIAVDEKGRRSVSRPTLFYMPHCEDWLYDNVLQANWVPRTLAQLVILGNSFQDYQERWSSPIGGTSEPPFYVIQFQQVAQEIPLKETTSLDLPGFNNMSWHFYPSPLPDIAHCIEGEV